MNLADIFLIVLLLLSVGAVWYMILRRRLRTKYTSEIAEKQEELNHLVAGGMEPKAALKAVQESLVREIQFRESLEAEDSHRNHPIDTRSRRMVRHFSFSKTKCQSCEQNTAEFEDIFGLWCKRCASQRLALDSQALADTLLYVLEKI